MLELHGHVYRIVLEPQRVHTYSAMLEPHCVHV